MSSFNLFYVIFCDADDMFSNILGIRMILDTIKNNPFEVLMSVFTEELKTPDDNYIYNQIDNNQIFIHGKVFNRKFLIDNNIRWGDDLLTHEDSYFNSLAISIAQNKRYIPTPYYMWCWNDNSVSRSDKFYVIKTYHHLIKSASKLSEELLKRDKLVDSMTMFCVNIFQTYYIMTGKFTEFKELEDVINHLKHLKPLAKDFYDRFTDLFNRVDQKDKLNIRLNCQKAAIEQGWYKKNYNI